MELEAGVPTFDPFVCLRFLTTWQLDFEKGHLKGEHSTGSKWKVKGFL